MVRSFFGLLLLSLVLLLLLLLFLLKEKLVLDVYLVGIDNLGCFVLGSEFYLEIGHVFERLSLVQLVATCVNNFTDFLGGRLEREVELVFGFISRTRDY